MLEPNLLDQVEDARPLRLRPLYTQVRAILVHRIATRHWPPGALLPSEIDLADDLGVSQGTIRKALIELEAENLIVRKQGRGSYVARHDDPHMLFLFNKLRPDVGGRQYPESRCLGVDVRPASAAIAKVFGLREGDRFVNLERVRSYAGEPCVLETILLPQMLFPGIEDGELPNNLYGLYRSQFGVTIVRATDKLKAVAAGRRESKQLSIPVGAPMLQIERISIAIDRRTVEWRISRCRTDAIHYLSDLN
jgi:GntR family transcriptional regulator